MHNCAKDSSSVRGAGTCCQLRAVTLISAESRQFAVSKASGPSTSLSAASWRLWCVCGRGGGAGMNGGRGAMVGGRVVAGGGGMKIVVWL